MKRGQPVLWILIIIAGTVSFFSSHRVYNSRSQTPAESIYALGLISQAGATVSSLEFQGIASDFFLLRVMTFLGRKFGEGISVSPEEWESVYHILEIATALDPKFWDPYLLAETMIMEGGSLERGNRLLLKAAKEIPDNYRPYFFLWFNSFYLQDDPVKAAFYMKEAIKRPGTPYYFIGLAARMDLYANRTQNAIDFLKSVIAESPNSPTNEYFKKRLISLQIIDYLEGKLKEYEQQHDAKAQDIGQLVQAGLIKKIPKDPYGGEFLILPNGRVYTSSKLVDRKK